LPIAIPDCFKKLRSRLVAIVFYDFLGRGDRFTIELGHSRYRYFVSAWEAERSRNGKCREKILR
jgi:hypothetical protein